METPPATPPQSPSQPPPQWPPELRAAFLDERTFRARTVLLFGAITDAVAADVSRRLLALDADSEAPIELIVSSPGGHLESGDAIHDVVRWVRAPVRIIGTGWVGSAATHVYVAAPRERRLCTPNTRFLIHQPSSGVGGPAADMAIQAREILRARERIATEIAVATGQALERVLRDIERDHWMSAAEAVDYGLVGRIVQNREDAR